MQFLRTAFWVILAVAVALFGKANNRPLEIKIWGDIVWETRIWFPILIAFLLGAIPFWISARATRWRLRRRLESSEKALAAAISAATPPPPPVSPLDALPDAGPLPVSNPATGPA
ncbi:lipopolysaccharide assembly protein LapA domain-containing protein [Sphingobium sp. AN641]|uniref:lipopolysaccharide assembly protein LapA domain-containing protein n=1 Tax=Sphingobium sp. AN641 TaxID=3133443 RepID=UPI0030BA5CF9